VAPDASGVARYPIDDLMAGHPSAQFNQEIAREPALTVEWKYLLRS
jgi:hypothetical protein